MDKNKFFIAILFSAYICVAMVTGFVIFKMLKDCSSLIEYLFYGLVSTTWIGFLLLIWVLLINYINEKRNF